MDTKELTYLNTLAISCLATGLVDEAQPAFELLATSAPDHSAGPVGLASVELARGNYDAACEILQQRADKLGVDKVLARKILKNALIATHRSNDADELHDRLAELNAANDDNEYLQQSHKFFGTGDPRLL
ncbi:hypothetical protein AB833_14250 [Chromatiales bacterium (ex Bugula neritina AB1)]|nr:hypothetical protein AB833_14250 [Chromatiales bacterium (ex Bugula neritina AB1)]